MERQGTSWSPEEDQQLYDDFIAGLATRDQASRHQRSEGAIRSRLKLLGLIDLDGTVVDPPPPFHPIERRQSNRENRFPETRRPGRKAERIFSANTADGWNVEVHSNLPLTEQQINRLATMLRSTLSRKE